MSDLLSLYRAMVGGGAIPSEEDSVTATGDAGARSRMRRWLSRLLSRAFHTQEVKPEAVKAPGQATWEPFHAAGHLGKGRKESTISQSHASRLKR